MHDYLTRLEVLRHHREELLEGRRTPASRERPAAGGEDLAGSGG
jgi:hypothetical protein